MKPILKLIKIIEKIATSLNNNNFFSNKRILFIYFTDSQLTLPIQLVLNQKCLKTAILHSTNKTYFKTDYNYRENCNFFK